jgi:hypothetical protein
MDKLKAVEKDKVTHINESTVYLEDIQKPRYVSVMFTFYASNKKITSRFVQDKNEAAEDAVMKLSLQDHVIIETYANLPWVK